MKTIPLPAFMEIMAQNKWLSARCADLASARDAAIEERDLANRKIADLEKSKDEMTDEKVPEDDLSK